MNNRTLVNKIDDLLEDTDFTQKYSTIVSELQGLKDLLLNTDPYQHFSQIIWKLHDFNPKSDKQKFEDLVKLIQQAINTSHTTGYDLGLHSSDQTESYNKGKEDGEKEASIDETNIKLEQSPEAKQEMKRKKYDSIFGRIMVVGFFVTSVLAAFVLAFKGYDLIPSAANPAKDKIWAGVILIALSILLLIISNLAISMFFTRKQRS